MLNNRFKKTLIDALHIVNEFKGKKRMLQHVQERLDRSLEMYEESLERECGKILKLRPTWAMNSIKNIKQ